MIGSTAERRDARLDFQTARLAPRKPNSRARDRHCQCDIWLDTTLRGERSGQAGKYVSEEEEKEEEKKKKKKKKKNKNKKNKKEEKKKKKKKKEEEEEEEEEEEVKEQPGKERYLMS
nr:unnamed protein product [Spirometra erinaceieuropaei]